MAQVAALYETRNLYREFLTINNPLTFEEWNKLPKDIKAVALYLQFFNEIVLAWEKANTLDFINCEDGVEIVNQYLEKNVEIIEKHPERFTPNYIYKVSYNCMYCICHDRKCDKDRYENETSAIVSTADGEVNLIDEFEASDSDVPEEADRSAIQREFWALVENQGVETEKVMRYLLTNNEQDLKKLSKRNRNYAKDPLKDVEVPFDKVDDIISNLRELLSSVSSNSALGQKMIEMGISIS